jgi:two-component system OmpR family sensor kinase
VRRIHNTVCRMTQLIDNLIGSARLLDGRADLFHQPTQVDLAPLLREVCALQRELTPEAEIRDRVPPSLFVAGDASLLGQLFGNLLSNAAKYSPHGGLIEVTAAQDGAHAAATIEDHGIGIPDNDRQRVFERYYRGSNTSGIVGSGVGLHLVETIVNLHKGTIVLDSREGEGSRFIIRLPAQPAFS